MLSNMNLLDSRVLVTGGAGLVGSHIVDDLVREGARVTVYDSFIRGRLEHLDWARKNGEVRIIEADIRDDKELRRAVQDTEYGFQMDHKAAESLDSQPGGEREGPARSHSKLQ